MTVGELVRALQEFPEDLNVVYVDDGQDCVVGSLWISQNPDGTEDVMLG
jgi:hypothetical protein